MKEGTLEVVVVSAAGIRHTNVIGRPAYYVIIQCGTQVKRTKTSKRKHKEICWNEKFTFHFASSEWKNLTHVKFRIMDKEYFSAGGFVGETILYVQGMITEANDKDFLEIRPTRYNVVLEDDTYKGEIRIGLKFIPNKEAYTERTTVVDEEQGIGLPICRAIMNFWRSPWWTTWRFLFPCDKQKQV
ncbi:elicitor-responsive protein 3 [Diospyros lotus]|uniref:elicitor-responsive protein 3 n=1 Tax=Diospyros lotus TaxID=55363 RepID=UPI00224CFED5|nr:elicitor-responsive protein 3 [Diospyros lotus]